MKLTDVILPFNPESNKGMQLVIVRDNKLKVERVIPLDRPAYIAVALEEDEWLKLDTEVKETINLDYNVSTPLLTGVFKYICYTLTPTKKTELKDPNSDYFLSNSSPVLKSIKPSKKISKPIINNKLRNTINK